MKSHLLKTSLIALGASVVISSAPLAVDVPNFAALDYVPANTAFFSGSLKAFPMKKYLEANKNLFTASRPQDMDEMFEDDAPTDKFFRALVKGYFANIAEPEQFMKAYGLGDETRMLMYMVDFHPVLKLEVEDGEAFIATIMAAEKDSGLVGVEHEIGGVKYRSYLLKEGTNNLFELVVASHDGWVTITVANANGNNGHLKVALGSAKPAKALSQTSILQDMTDKYGFDGTQLGYVDHRIVADRFTSAEPIAFTAKNDWKELAKIQTPACRAEFADIAKAWPRTVMGTSKFSVTNTEYSADLLTIIESTHKATNDALMDLRGFIPAHVGGAADQVISMAFGLNANKITGALTALWTAATSVKYECVPLADMQKELMLADPASLGLFAGMAQGIMGLSATIYEADVNLPSMGQPQINALDVLISLASENPIAQLQTGSMMLPMLRGLNIPADGTPVVLNDVLRQVNMVGGQTFAAISGKHLNVYKGSEAAKGSAALKDEAIDANGFFEIYMHYGKLFRVLSKAMEGNDDPAIEQFKALSDSKMKLRMALDFTENGIEIAADMDVKY
ncbi:MAG: hypothetical protein COB24_08415 [Hyphomicrobiales bacterium]|nr:MAG: hypothetical protein COB24_08415 [Hyphomicrobiales bacterium]